MSTSPGRLVPGGCAAPHPPTHASPTTTFHLLRHPRQGVGEEEESLSEIGKPRSLGPSPRPSRRQGDELSDVQVTTARTTSCGHAARPQWSIRLPRSTRRARGMGAAPPAMLGRSISAHRPRQTHVIRHRVTWLTATVTDHASDVNLHRRHGASASGTRRRVPRAAPGRAAGHHVTLKRNEKTRRYVVATSKSGPARERRAGMSDSTEARGASSSLCRWRAPVCFLYTLVLGGAWLATRRACKVMNIIACDWGGGGVVARGRSREDALEADVGAWLRWVW